LEEGGGNVFFRIFIFTRCIFLTPLMIKNAIQLNRQTVCRLTESKGLCFCSTRSLFVELAEEMPVRREDCPGTADAPDNAKLYCSDPVRTIRKEICISIPMMTCFYNEAESVLEIQIGFSWVGNRKGAATDMVDYYSPAYQIVYPARCSLQTSRISSMWAKKSSSKTPTLWK